MLFISVKKREHFSSNIEEVCPYGEYCGNKISTNEIAPVSNNVTINKNTDMNHLNTSGISIDSHNLVNINSDGKTQLGSDDMKIKLTNDNNITFKKRVTFKPENTMFHNNAIFMNNVYFKDNVDLDHDTSVCFFNNHNKNCLNKQDIDTVMNADVTDLDDRNTVLRGACISSQSLDPSIFQNNSDIFNQSPLDSSMKCMTEAAGVKKLRLWHAEKDDLEPLQDPVDEPVVEPVE